MIRLFIGLELPEEARARLAALACGVRGARWVAGENLHLTLRFIGEVDNGAASDIDAALARVRATALDLALAGVGTFGARRRVRMIWAGTDPCERLAALQRKVEAAVQCAGQAAETRKFHPHVTLARLRDASAATVAPFIAAHATFQAGPYAMEAFTLFSSVLGHEGPTYRVERRYPLASNFEVLAAGAAIGER